eukprot:1481847-Amphidinium_carterae.2
MRWNQRPAVLSPSLTVLHRLPKLPQLSCSWTGMREHPPAHFLLSSFRLGLRVLYGTLRLGMGWSYALLAIVIEEQRSETDAALPNPSFEAVHFVRRLAREQKSEDLSSTE